MQLLIVTQGGLEMGVIKPLRIGFPHTVVQRHYQLIVVGFATQKTTMNGTLKIWLKQPSNSKLP